LVDMASFVAVINFALVLSFMPTADILECLRGLSLVVFIWLRKVSLVKQDELAGLVFSRGTYLVKFTIKIKAKCI